MRNIIFVALALFLVVSIGSAQTIIVDKPLLNSSGKSYFQLTNSVGDSSKTLALDIRQPVVFGGRTYSLFPDSMYAVWYATGDSIYSININAKTLYTNQYSTAAYYKTTFIDSAYSATAAASWGATLVPVAAMRGAVDNGFGVSVIAKSTRNAAATATASKLYLILRCYYKLP